MLIFCVRFYCVIVYCFWFYSVRIYCNLIVRFLVRFYCNFLIILFWQILVRTRVWLYFWWRIYHFVSFFFLLFLQFFPFFCNKLFDFFVLPVFLFFVLFRFPVRIFFWVIFLLFVQFNALFFFFFIKGIYHFWSEFLYLILVSFNLYDVLSWKFENSVQSHGFGDFEVDLVPDSWVPDSFQNDSNPIVCWICCHVHDLKFICGWKQFPSYFQHFFFLLRRENVFLKFFLRYLFWVHLLFFCCKLSFCLLVGDFGA